MPIKTVLTVATFTQRSENALERAAELAARQRARLYVLHRSMGDAADPADPHRRLELRTLQLARRYGLDARPIHHGPERLARMLARKAQELLMVVDAVTAQGHAQGSGLLRHLLVELRGGRLVDRSPCPVLVVNRPHGDGGRLALLPYATDRDAAGSLAFARALVPDHELELFFLGPREPAPARGPLARETVHLNEWPPPGMVRHSDYLSTRLNRAIRHFDNASTARRIRNQADFSGADLVIVPHVASSWAERFFRSSLHDRLLSELPGDLVLLPDPRLHRTALAACARLQPTRGPVELLNGQGGARC